MKHRVRMEIRHQRDDGKPGRLVRSIDQDGVQGALELLWDGNDETGKKLGRGKFVARLVVVGAGGEVLDEKEVPFVNDTLAVQEKTYGQIAGNLQLHDGRGSENTEIELVNDQGEVIETTASNEAGNYRFNNVKEGKYKVRVKKRGFVSSEVNVVATPARDAQADVKMLAN